LLAPGNLQLAIWCRDRVMVTAFDPSLPVESRVSRPSAPLQSMKNLPVIQRRMAGGLRSGKDAENCPLFALGQRHRTTNQSSSISLWSERVPIRRVFIGFATSTKGDCSSFGLQSVPDRAALFWIRNFIATLVLPSGFGFAENVPVGWSWFARLAIVSPSARL
jgi:hypothetical protein